jgi:hypothetical protein
MKPVAIFVLAALIALTLPCARTLAGSDPYLLITSVPRYGDWSGGVLSGKVFSNDGSKVNFDNYRVMLYLEVDVENHAYTADTPYTAYEGYPKPYYSSIFTRIAKSGAFKVDVTTGGIDHIARSYTVLLVTADASHRIVDVQRVIRYEGEPYPYSIDARKFRPEPTRYNAPAVKVQRMIVRSGKSAALPAICGYAGDWVVEDDTCAKISGKSVAGLAAHKSTSLVFTVTKVLDQAHPYSGKILSEGDKIPVELFVACASCANQKIELQKTSGSIAAGKTWQIRASGKNPCLWRRQWTCRSLNESVARVNNQGLVTGVSPGKVSIVVTNVFGKSKTIKLTIRAAK